MVQKASGTCWSLCTVHDRTEAEAEGLTLYSSQARPKRHCCMCWMKGLFSLEEWPSNCVLRAPVKSLSWEPGRERKQRLENRSGICAKGALCYLSRLTRVQLSFPFVYLSLSDFIWRKEFRRKGFKVFENYIIIPHKHYVVWSFCTFCLQAFEEHS